MLTSSVVKNDQQLHDTELIEIILSGDTESYRELLHRYQAYIFKIVSRYIPANHIEDVAQEVSIRVYTSLRKYDTEKSFKSWLATITIRTCYDSLRKLYSSSEIPLAELTENTFQFLDTLLAAASKNDFQKKLNTKEAKELLDAAFQRLSPEDQMVIKLIHFEGYTTREVGRTMGWSLANVKVRSFRSRKKLHSVICNLLTRNGG